MKRTTIYLDPDLEARLRVEASRLRVPMAELIRQAIRDRLDAAQRVASPYAGAFSSGRSDTAEAAEELLEGGFGRD